MSKSVADCRREANRQAVAVPSTPRSLSAALLSLVFHAAAFLLLGLVVQPSRQGLQSEPERTVQIVLARTNASNRDRYEDRLDATQKQTASSNTPEAEGRVADELVPTVEQIAKTVPSELALPVSGSFSQAAGTLSAKKFTATRSNAGRIPFGGDLDKFVSEEQARLRANAPVGDPVEIELFGGPPAAGRSFLFLIDRSHSMGREGLGALEAAEQELLAALQPLQPFHKFQVVAYHHQCVFLNRREMLPATEENKRSVRGFLSNLAPFGATEHEMALHSALSHAPDVIYLLTDGGDPELSEPQIRTITKIAARRTRIHCIQFGFGARQNNNHFLERLATQNGGGYLYVDVAVKR